MASQIICALLHRFMQVDHHAQNHLVSSIELTSFVAEQNIKPKSGSDNLYCERKTHIVLQSNGYLDWPNEWLTLHPALILVSTAPFSSYESIAVSSSSVHTPTYEICVSIKKNFLHSSWSFSPEIFLNTPVPMRNERAHLSPWPYYSNVRPLPNTDIVSLLTGTTPAGKSIAFHRLVATIEGDGRESGKACGIAAVSWTSFLGNAIFARKKSVIDGLP